MEKIIKQSIYLSLFIQIVTTLISLRGFDIQLQEKDYILYDILKLEALVQLVEAVFYIWVIYGLKDLKLMTPRRYIDWFITTPTMLFTTIIFMEYLRYEKNEQKQFTLSEFIEDNKEYIIKIVILNQCMLLFGYLGETEIINKEVSITVGFMFFFYNFYIIYERYAKHTDLGIKLFIFLIIIWSLYGVAAYMNIKVKNLMYNCLDIISKNFYGLYIYYYIYQKSLTY